MARLQPKEDLQRVRKKHVIPQAQVSSIFAPNQGIPWMARLICVVYFEAGVVRSVFAGFRFILCEVYPGSLPSKFGMS
jgi:hypothetical protein